LGSVPPESGDLIETILDESGERINEKAVGAVKDLPVEEEYTDEEECTLHTVKEQRESSSTYNARAGFRDEPKSPRRERGAPLSTNLRRRSLTPLLQRACLPPMKFHQLRHTAATILLLKNVNPKVVSGDVEVMY
jgi:integrase